MLEKTSTGASIEKILDDGSIWTLQIYYIHISEIPFHCISSYRSGSLLSLLPFLFDALRKSVFSSLPHWALGMWKVFSHVNVLESCV
jgi:hypothetical protein